MSPTSQPDGSFGDPPPERPLRARVRDVDLPGHGTLALVTLTGDDPARPPTLGPLGLSALRDVLLGQRRRAASGEIVALAVTGTGRHLAAGADLREMARVRTVEQARALGALGHSTYRLLGELGVPTLAILNGTALGGGLELALHCTYRTVGADVSALGLPETGLGLVPAWGGCTLLPGLLGIEATLDLVVDRPLAGNRMTDAGRALATGLVDAVLPTQDLVRHSLGWLADVLDAGAAGSPVPRRAREPEHVRREAVARARTRVDRRLHGAAPAPYRALSLLADLPDDRDAAFAAEDEALAELLLSPELRAALYAFELTRAARHAAPAPTSARPVRVLGIVGAGLMATQIAVLAAQRLAIPVRMREVDEERAAAGRARVADLVGQLRARGRASDAQADRILASVTVGTDLRALADADLVVEAVSEVLALKRRVFAELEEVVRADTVLATNTSALSVAAMATGLAHPQRVVGLHLFNPVARMPLVEIVRAPASDGAAVATAVAVAIALGKSPVTVADRPGFVVNRLLLRLLGEVLGAVERGTDVRVADAALLPLGLPMRPFALLQLVGLPVALHVLESLRADLGDRYPRSPGLERLAAAGRPVVARGGPDDEDAVDPTVQELFGPPGGPGALDEAGVRTAVLGALTEEIGLLLAEGVVDGARDVDLCLLQGARWPLHLGGICPYLDRTGWSVRVLGHRLLPTGVADVPTP
ncbi:MAG TPA: 3-hydroxyacyl-CoA dehydrogenase NAD-binding domain-containing protein [Actinotalea sp.]|nr:3-hydroxyacyl-CoA dehydrogenase NAD-binding domain-containing protein [Actinotalea sp.]